jgi:hypothetical protein
MKTQRAKQIAIIVSMLVVVVSAILVIMIGNGNFAPTDSSALYGGSLESGYPSAGFLVSYADDKVKTCGFSVLGPNVAVTAAHCVDDTQIMYLGKGEFNFDHANQVRVIQARQKQGWVQQTAREDDIAILNFINGGYFTNFAEVSTPVEGCNYRVVAYGRTENPDETTKPRKSAVFCVNAIFDKIVYMTAQNANAGICFGDSGSPVYFNGTNSLMGVVASIVKPKDGEANADPCQFGNTAIVVRADANESLINNTAKEFDPSSPAISLNNQLTIDVATGNQFNVLSFDGIRNAANSLGGNWTPVLIGLATFVLLFLGFLMWQQENELARLRQLQQRPAYEIPIAAPVLPHPEAQPVMAPLPAAPIVVEPEVINPEDYR